MRLASKRIGLAAGLLVALLLAAGLILNTLVSPNDFKPRLASLVRKVSGLEPAFQGDVSLNFFPTGLRFEDVSLTVPAGPTDPADPTDPEDTPLLRFESLELAASLLPLLQGRIEASAIFVNGLECNLLRDAQGQLNLPTPPVRDIEAEQEHVRVVTEQNETLFFAYSIHELNIVNARVLYVDEARGTRHELRDIELKAQDITSHAPFSATYSCAVESSKPKLRGSVRMQGEFTADPVARVFAMERYELQALLQGEDSPPREMSLQLSGSAGLDGRSDHFELRDLLAILADTANKGRELSLSCPSLELDLTKGDLERTSFTLRGPEFRAELDIEGQDMATAPTFTGELRVPTFSPRKTLQALDIAPPATPDATSLEQLRLEAAFHMDAQKLNLKNCELSLDKATLRLQGHWTPDKNEARFELQCQDLDMDRYLPLKKSTKPKDTSVSSGKTGEASEKTPQKEALLPQELDPLRLAGDVHLSNLRLAGLSLPKADGHMLLHERRLRGNLDLASFYKGRVQADYTADLTTALPALGLKCKAQGIQLQPLLRDARSSSFLSGTAALSADLSAQGLNEKQLLRSLSGSASLKAVNGVVHGYSLSPATLKQGGKGGDTPYQEISASGPLNKGVAHLQHIDARFAPHGASGSGKVDLVNQTLDLHLKANILGLAGVPVSVTGSWNTPKVSVNTVSVAEGGLEALGVLLQAPEKAGEALGTALGVPKEAGEALGNIFRSLVK